MVISKFVDQMSGKGSMFYEQQKWILKFVSKDLSGTGPTYIQYMKSFTKSIGQ